MINVTTTAAKGNRYFQPKKRGTNWQKKGTFSSSIEFRVSSKPLEIKGLKHSTSFGTKIATYNTGTQENLRYYR
jgi:hypothetical protein